ncbi:MAG: response regulator [Burkholderiales bacterium]|nr:response regulator [Bacteroidia bacterium]
MIRAIVIDDEVHNRNVLKTLLSKYCPLINVIAECEKAIDAFDKIKELEPQLIFLDIKMPGKSGFDLLKMFSRIDFEVIFVSAFNEYAITAFEFNALGYILKPIDYSKLIITVDKAIFKITSNEKSNSVFHFIKTLDEKNDVINKISVHHNDKVILLNINYIVSVEAKGGTCEIKLDDGKNYYSSKELKLFEEILEKAGNFIRISKSVIVNADYIISYSKGDICNLEVQNSGFYEVSRRKKSEVINRMKI